MARLAAAVAVLSLATSACTSDAPRGALTVRDSSGVTIVENGSVDSAPEWCLSPDAEVVIGGDETDATSQLYQATSAAMLPSGRIAVANSGTHQVYVFDDSGQRIAILGNQGTGPGSFSAGLIRVRAAADGGIVASQLGPAPKLARFGADGSLIEEIRLPSRPGGAWMYPMALPDGTILSLFEAMTNESSHHEDVRRSPVALVRVPNDGSGPDTIAFYSGTEVFYADVGPQRAFPSGFVNGPRAIRPLFYAGSRITGGGDPWHIVAADQRIAGYDVFDETGAMTQRVRWVAAVRRPSGADIDEARERHVETFRFDPTAGRRSLAALPSVEHVPVFDELHAGRDNRVWVRRYTLPTEEISTWWVFDDAGRLRASIRLPAQYDLFDSSGDSLLIRVTDELDVERIELWKIRRDSACPVS